MWLGKVVATKELGSTAVPKCKKKYTGRQQRIKDTRYGQGDWLVTIVWYGRVGDDEERLGKGADLTPPSLVVTLHVKYF